MNLCIMEQVLHHLQLDFMYFSINLDLLMVNFILQGRLAMLFIIFPL